MSVTFNIEHQIGFLYSHLGDGQTAAGEVCPACKGGSSKERTFSVSRRGDVLLYKCHRASCPCHGALTVGRLLGRLERAVQAKASFPSVRTSAISEGFIEFFSTKYSIPRSVVESCNLTFTDTTDRRLGGRVCFPIYGPDHKVRGNVYRSYEPFTVPKAIIELKNTNDIAMSWYKWLRKSNILVIVEDPTSAIKLAQEVHSVALCSTNLSESRVDEIAQNNNYDLVLICLDNDATYEAIKYQLKYKRHIKGLQVRGLAKDIKDMNTEEFAKFIREIKGDRDAVSELQA